MRLLANNMTVHIPMRCPASSWQLFDIHQIRLPTGGSVTSNNTSIARHCTTRFAILCFENRRWHSAPAPFRYNSCLTAFSHTPSYAHKFSRCKSSRQMSMKADHAVGPNSGSAPLLAKIGSAMRRRRGTILALQWIVVFFYFSLLIIPAFMPLPPEDAHRYNNLRLFTQFLFWGIWWPFVMLSTMLLGRVWCGVFCPEGALTEFASRHGLARSIPRWMRWGGWPLTAFVCSTIYGQLIGVYTYPSAALLLLICAAVVAFGAGAGVAGEVGGGGKIRCA